MTPARNLDLNFLLTEFDNFLFDFDGVLHVNGKSSPHAIRFLEILNEREKQVFVISNNPKITPYNGAERFKADGFEHLTNESIISPNHVALDHFETMGYRGKTIFVAGVPPIAETMRRGLNMNVIQGYVHDIPSSAPDHGHRVHEYIEKHPWPIAVLHGHDSSMSFLDVAVMAHYLRDPKVAYFSAGADKCYHTTHDIRLPAAAAIAAAVGEVTGRQPTVLGKPSAALSSYLKKKGFDPKRTIMFGDNLHTDISMANGNEYASCLTTTGVTHPEEVDKAIEDKRWELVPTYISDFKDYV